MSIRVMIVDDHRILRAGLKTLLNPDPNLEVVGEATNGEEALQIAREIRPDVVLMDIGMPGMDALEATRQFVRMVPNSRVLILTMYEDGELLQAYLRAGASGYIIKRAAESELIDAIYAVWRGMIYIHPSLMQALLPPTQKESPQIPLETEPLTSREMEVLHLAAHGHTNREIASTLNISVRTVETHRANLMEKLNLHSRVELTRYAEEHGLL
jgi:DNA-binding NarL/FixJ family response regulator